jgi:hypothetical protein
MVVFNDPVPVDHPALQAVLMALEMRDAIGALTSKWRRFGHEIGFGIGIAHGHATLGTIGFEGRFDYAAIGTVSNVASRLCDEAKPGQILVSERVLVAVEDAVKVEPVGEFEVKGIRRPLAAYNVVGVAANFQASAAAASPARGGLSFAPCLDRHQTAWRSCGPLRGVCLRASFHYSASRPGPNLPRLRARRHATRGQWYATTVKSWFSATSNEPPADEAQEDYRYRSD